MVHSCVQADAASGKLQLKDSGARLHEGISETAARLAQVLSTLAQHGAAEPHWPPQCFQSCSLHFIDVDGQVQVRALTMDSLCVLDCISMLIMLPRQIPARSPLLPRRQNSSVSYHSEV